MKGQTYIILALVFALIVAIFAVINVDPVEVDYLFGEGNAPLILVILVSVLMGGMITAAVGGVKVLRLQKEIRSLRRKDHQPSESAADPEVLKEGQADKADAVSVKNDD
ncbi:LapA family protein [Sediminibacillus albus]|nr:lipopolysaccharide assembly protein LapA domain-containing protein [Sediminibacillus albus]